MWIERKRGLAESDVGSGAHAVFKNDSGEKFWGNKGAGVFIICRKTGRVLACKRSKYVNEPGTYGVVGGAIDPGEDPLKAAKREVKEELKFDGKVQFIVGPVYTSPGKKFAYHNYVALVDEEFTPKLDWETESAVWMDWEDFEKLYSQWHFGLRALHDKARSIISQFTRVTGESLAEAFRIYGGGDFSL
jgi:8-oxo-dGTP pyrophosphatase MutT (NUDIX family)